METTFYSLQQLAETVKDQTTDMQNILNGQIYIDGAGWTNIILTKNLRMELAGLLSELYGGRAKTKENVRYTLINERPQHWGLSRTYIELRKGQPRIYYITGQDQTWENAQIRKYLSK